MNDEKWMRAAIEQAQKALTLNEVPIGAVVIKGDEIIGVGYNRRETGKNALYHAELLAIDDACRRLNGWRLWECELYVTLEPCPMCAGAIINSRLRRVVYGASDPKAGSCRSVIDLFALPYNHRPECIGGILQSECSALLTNFFKSLRSGGLLRKSPPDTPENGQGDFCEKVPPTPPKTNISPIIFTVQE